jgi:uncharacterized membrane protein
LSTAASIRAVRPAFALWLGAALFVAAAFGVSWWRWYSYQYHTFDLAFYVQGLWLALRGQFQVSLLEVPLLGNHAEPIVFLLLPLFALWPHPMLLVLVQALALATMPFTGARILRRLMGEAELRWSTCAFALTALLAPAAGYMAIHEFHPEALCAPILLLLIEARLAGRLGRFWLWFVLGVACKENIALLLATWCVVFAWTDRRRGWAWQWRWNVAPLLTTLTWLAMYALWLSPWLNGGRVDYANLYSHLGKSPAEIILHPQPALAALWEGATGGNLVWAMLATWALLPLLRLRWLLIPAPLLLQHLLSSRSSEWQIYYHYAAPLLPFCWMAAAEVVASRPRWPWLPWLPLAACLLLQPFIGPVREIVADAAALEQKLWERSWKAPLVQKLATLPEARVACGIPFLSHLAHREGLHSIHFVLKGVKTLSRRQYQPQYAPDFVLIDFADEPTFSKKGAFYHPPGAIDGVPLLSSDELLQQFLARHTPRVYAVNSLALYDRGTPPPARDITGTELPLFPHTILRAAEHQPGEGRSGRILLDWRYPGTRRNIPWLTLHLKDQAHTFVVPLGMCAPQAGGDAASEVKQIILPPWIPAGEYRATAVFVDQIRNYWGKSDIDPIVARVPLGTIVVPN